MKSHARQSCYWGPGLIGNRIQLYVAQPGTSGKSLTLPSSPLFSRLLKNDTVVLDMCYPYLGMRELLQMT